MNNYLATVRAMGRVLQTAVFAQSPLHARYVLEFQFGIGNVHINPKPVSLLLADAVVGEAAVTQANLNPHQQRIKTLQRQKDLISKSIESERAKDKLSKAQQQMRTATQFKSSFS
jgi:hypothetical protein